MPLFLSSGDLIADRRYNRAMEYAESGELRAAAELLAQALERVPNFASAWFAFGELSARTGDNVGAIAAFRQAIAADPDDVLGATLHLVRLQASLVDDGMPPGYLRALFDQYAPRFEQAVREGLQYRAPQLLREAIESVRDSDVHFGRMIDLGCGTGLAGEALRSHCRSIIGVDLSPGMIEVARRKGIYDELIVADMAAWLAGQPADAADLVVAADTFVYLADLAPICRAVARILAPDGLLAFTVETHAGSGIVFGEKLRYAHGADHVRAAIEAAGLLVLTLDAVSTRTENRIPVPGLLAVAGRGCAPPKAGSAVTPESLAAREIVDLGKK